MTSVHARLAIAESSVHIDLKSWKSRGSRMARIRAFERHIHPRALHGSRTWHITDKVLHELRKWENRVVRTMLGMRRKILPGGALEEVWHYRTRAGKVVADLYAALKIKPIWLKALTSVFREAWRERNTGPLRNNPLPELRNWRSRVWWAGIEHIPASQRTVGVDKRRRTGPVRVWEDVLVDACGMHWRDVRSTCADGKDWNLIAPSAIRQLTFKYKLPHAPALLAACLKTNPGKLPIQPDEGRPTVAFTSDDLEGGPGLTLVGDCQPLANVLNGDELLLNKELEPLCTRVTENIIDLCKTFNQYGKATTFISWRPRHLNQLADLAANQCMDNSNDHNHWNLPLPCLTKLQTLRVVGFSDGGLRKNVGKAATGWAILAIDGTEAWILGLGGTAVQAGSHGSFGVEAFALEELVTNLLSLCSNHGVEDNSWKIKSVPYVRENLINVPRG